MTADRRDRSTGSKRAATISLGHGRVAPYPQPVDDVATRIGKANRRRDTKPEVRLRAALHHRGLRFRKDHIVSAADLNVRVDVVFNRAKVAVFVDGCFWHGCPEHQRVPHRNQDYWVPKLRSNAERDRRIDNALKAAGWRVVRIWEHEDPAHASERVEALIRGTRAPVTTDA